MNLITVCPKYKQQRQRATSETGFFFGETQTKVKQLTKILEKSNSFVLPCESKDRQQSWYLNTARLNNGTEVERNRIVEGLKKNRIGAEICNINPDH